MEITKKSVVRSAIVRFFVLLAIVALIYMIVEVLRTPKTIEQIVQAVQAEEQFVKSCEMLEEDDILISKHGHLFYVYLNLPERFSLGTKSLPVMPGSMETNTYEQFYYTYGACRVVKAGSEEWIQIVRGAI